MYPLFRRCNFPWRPRSGDKRASGLGVEGLLEPFDDISGDIAEDDDVIAADGDDNSRPFVVFLANSESMLKDPFIVSLAVQFK